MEATEYVRKVAEVQEVYTMYVVAERDRFMSLLTSGVGVGL